jgi:hypothetical protein
MFGDAINEAIQGSLDIPVCEDTTPTTTHTDEHMEQYRELQFKSNFHQSSYSWRQMLEPSELDEILFREVSRDVKKDNTHKRTFADTEVMLDSETHEFVLDTSNDYLLGMIQSKSPCLAKFNVNDLIDLSFDEHVFDNEVRA